MPETEIEKDLIIEEYKSCRDLIGRNIEIIERNEVYVVGACAAVFVFSYEKGQSVLTLGAAVIPITLAVIGLMRFRALGHTIDIINTYLCEIEDKYPVIRYTHRYKDLNKDPKLKRARYRVWHMLIFVSTLFFLHKTWIYFDISERFCLAYPNTRLLCQQLESQKIHENDKSRE